MKNVLSILSILSVWACCPALANSAEILETDAAWIPEFICYGKNVGFQKLSVNRSATNLDRGQFEFTYKTTKTSVFETWRRAVPPGADELITYSYNAFSSDIRYLVVTVDPDPKPVPKKQYAAKWNKREPLTCVAQ